MEQTKVLDNLYRFRTYMSIIDLSFHQYLLLDSNPMLIHTGSRQQAEALVPQLKCLLGDKTLQYIFISHFESDECGGLALLQEHFPQAKPVCSQVTARQLMGFGLAGDVITKNPGDALETGEYKMKFLSYPSEMHLWEGLLAFEEMRGILFSSDLFIRRGNTENELVQTDWQDEIKYISSVQIPSPEALCTMQETLAKLPVKYIMPGHGQCLRVI